MKTFFCRSKTLCSLAVALLAFGVNTALAQQLEINWGEKFSPGNDFDLKAPIGTANNNIYFKSANSKFMQDSKIAISTIDGQTLNFKGNGLPSVQEVEATVVSITPTKQHTWLIARSPTANKTERITAYKMKANGETVAKSNLLVEFKKETAVQVDYGHIAHYPSTCDVLISSDSTKLALIVNAAGSKKIGERYYLKVFNAQDLSKVWEQIVVIPSTEKRYCGQRNASSLTNDGEVILTGKVYNNDHQKEDSKAGTADYKYVSYIFDGKDEKGKSYDWKLGGKFVAQTFVKARRDNGNTLIVATIMKDKDPSKNQMEGFYGFEIEAKTGNIINDFKQIIPASKVQNLTAECFDKKSQTFNQSLKINNLYLQKDGSLLIVTGMNTQMSNFDGSKYFLDDAVFCLDANRKLKWATASPKKVQVPVYNEGDLAEQFSEKPEKRQGSISLFKNDELFLIYYDSEKNIAKAPDGKVSTVGLSFSIALAAAKIDKDGNLSRRAISNVKDMENTLISPFFSFQVSDDEWVLAADGGMVFNKTTKSKIGRVRIK